MYECIMFLCRLLFWSGFGLAAKIQRSWMDGRHVEAIVTEDISGPNSLTLDIPVERLYWVDLDRNELQSCSLDGTKR